MSYHEGSNWQANKEDKGEKLYKTDAAFDKEVRDTLNGSYTAPGTRESKWRRYRFKTKSVDDCRPLVFNPKYPWWCSGYELDGTPDNPKYKAATIIAYLPILEDLKKYWDDAFDIEYTDEATIKFSDRFPKPKYFEE